MSTPRRAPTRSTKGRLAAEREAICPSFPGERCSGAAASSAPEKNRHFCSMFANSSRASCLRIRVSILDTARSVKGLAGGGLRTPVPHGVSPLMACFALDASLRVNFSGRASPLSAPRSAARLRKTRRSSPPRRRSAWGPCVLRGPAGAPPPPCHSVAAA